MISTQMIAGCPDALALHAPSGNVKIAVQQPFLNAGLADDDADDELERLLSRLDSTDLPPSFEQEPVVEGIGLSSKVQSNHAAPVAKTAVGCWPQVSTGPLSDASLQCAWSVPPVQDSSMAAVLQDKDPQSSVLNTVSTMVHSDVALEDAQTSRTVDVSTAYSVPPPSQPCSAGPSSAPVALQSGHALARSKSCSSKLSARTSIAKPAHQQQGLRCLKGLAAVDAYTELKTAQQECESLKAMVTHLRTSNCCLVEALAASSSKWQAAEEQTHELLCTNARLSMTVAALQQQVHMLQQHQEQHMRLQQQCGQFAYTTAVPCGVLAAAPSFV